MRTFVSRICLRAGLVGLALHLDRAAARPDAARRGTRRSCSCPLPDTPAMPTISPLCDGQVDALEHRLAGVVVGVQVLDRPAAARRASVPGRAAPPWSASPRRSSSTPSRRCVSSLDLPAARVACRAAARSRRRRSRVTSRNLWVMISDRELVLPRLLVQQPEHLVGLAGRQHRGRLVEERAASGSGRAASGSRASASGPADSERTGAVQRHLERLARP